MTVCVAVKVQDCLVFATDSASTLSTTLPDGSQQVLNVYNNADKIFNLHRKLPIMAMTCGLGHIGGRSISSLAKELRIRLMNTREGLDQKDYSIEQVVKYAFEFFAGHYSYLGNEKRESDNLEFWIGGYGSENTHAEIWKIEIQNGQIIAPAQINQESQPHGVSWGGQGTAIARLLFGIDPASVSALERSGLNAPSARGVYEQVREALETTVINQTMPVIDAIQLAEFLVDTTKGYFSFAYGSNIVGGPTDIATVTRYEAFKWIKRKHYYSINLNRRDHDHA